MRETALPILSLTFSSNERISCQIKQIPVEIFLIMEKMSSKPLRKNKSKETEQQKERNLLPISLTALLPFFTYFFFYLKNYRIDSRSDAKALCFLYTLY